MKATGIVRKIDDLGRIVLPKEIRDSEGWNSGQPMEMFMIEEGMVIRPYKSNLDLTSDLSVLATKINQRNELSSEEVGFIEYIAEVAGAKKLVQRANAGL